MRTAGTSGGSRRKRIKIFNAAHQWQDAWGLHTGDAWRERCTASIPGCTAEQPVRSMKALLKPQRCWSIAHITMFATFWQEMIALSISLNSRLMALVAVAEVPVSESTCRHVAALMFKHSGGSRRPLASGSACSPGYALPANRPLQTAASPATALRKITCMPWQSLMAQGLQRVRHAQTKSKNKTETPNTQQHNVEEHKYTYVVLAQETAKNVHSRTPG